MSSDPRLLAEIEALRSSIEALRLRVQALEEERDPLRADLAGTSALSSYTAVTSISHAPGSEVSRASAAGSEVASSDIPGRVELARQVGLYLRRCLGPGPRGSSGRDRLRLQNRCYIIIADFHGRPLQEVAVVSAFADVKRICKQGSDCGQAIFVGLPTRWEAKVALQAGDFELPATLRDE